MNIRSLVQVEVEKEGRLYYFFMPIGAPYADAIEAAKKAGEDIHALYEEAKKQQEEREKKSNKEEDKAE